MAIGLIKSLTILSNTSAYTPMRHNTIIFKTIWYCICKIQEISFDIVKCCIICCGSVEFETILFDTSKFDIIGSNRHEFADII